MASVDLLLNHQTGEIDWTWLKRLALARAQGEYGNSNPPIRYVRSAIRELRDRASSMRTAWRRDHGLRDDSHMVMVNVPTWGNSGDGFGR